MKPNAGFTLLEILVVLAIMSILLGIGYSSLLGSIRRGEVMEGVRTFAGDIERARSSAQKQSVTATIAWTTAAGQPLDGYTLTRSGTTQNRMLSDRVKVTCVSMTGSACNLASPQLVFSAPYAEASGGAVFRIDHKVNGIRPTYVKIGGVTGKVSVSDTQD